MAASATLALKAGVWLRRGRLFMVSPVRGDHRRFQAETPLIALCRFAGPALTVLKPFGDGSDQHYMVRFHGKDGKPALGEEYERFIDRDGRGDPQQYICDFNKRIGYKAA